MSQNNKILIHLRENGTISAMEALHLYGCWSLSRRICDLKEKGHNIVSERKNDITGKRYVRYHLVTQE